MIYPMWTELSEGHAAQNAFPACFQCSGLQSNRTTVAQVLLLRTAAETEKDTARLSWVQIFSVFPVSCLKEKGLTLLDLPWVSKRRLKQLLIKEENAETKEEWTRKNCSARKQCPASFSRDSFQFSSVTQSCLILCDPWTAAGQASLSITNSQSLLKLMSIESCHPTISSSVVQFSSCLQSFPTSGSFPMSEFFASGAKVLELHLQHQSFWWTFRTDFH